MENFKVFLSRISQYAGSLWLPPLPIDMGYEVENILNLPMNFTNITLSLGLTKKYRLVGCAGNLYTHKQMKANLV